MKTVFIFLLVLGPIPGLFAQKQACKDLHEGTFRLVDKLAGTTVMQRTKDIQVEENVEMGVKMIFSINWINDCTYELRAKEIIKGDPVLMGNKGDVITVNIKEIRANSYLAVTTANFTNFVLEKEIEILK